MTTARATECHARHGLTFTIIAGLVLAGCGDPAPTTKPTNSDRNGGAGGSRTGGSGVVRAGGAGGVAVAGAGGAVAAGGAGGSDPGAGGAGDDAAPGEEGGTDATADADPAVDMAPAGPACNNGVVEPGEECDLGAMNETAPYGPEKCSKTCKKAPFCGDDVKNNAEEECDNGQQNSDTATGMTGCTRACKVAPYCGDRDKDPNEECDSGPNGRQPVNGMAGCSPDCKTIRPPSCGDGVTNAGEECDNGAANNDTAIGANACTTECNRPKCGDTLKQANEECDRGPTGALPRNNVDGCSTTCKALLCGNLKVDAVGEECDKGSDNTRDDSTYGRQGACNRQCKTIKLFCGDRIPTAPEACDEGPTGKAAAAGVNGCLPNCTVIPALPLPRCGNKIVEGTEQCDLGSMNTNTGAYGVKDGCNTDCRKTTQFCGDGTPNGPEACDGGPNGLEPTQMKEGCSKTCTVRPKLATCANGVVEAPEECDDGANNLPSPNPYGPKDRCASDCKKITLFCGDGIINGVETCDDKEKNVDSVYLMSPIAGNPKPCNRTTCTVIPFCGDGTRQSANGEECDLGTGNGGSSACRSDCQDR
jgi:hypothetical protein